MIGELICSVLGSLAWLAVLSVVWVIWGRWRDRRRPAEPVTLNSIHIEGLGSKDLRP